MFIGFLNHMLLVSICMYIYYVEIQKYYFSQLINILQHHDYVFIFRQFSQAVFHGRILQIFIKIIEFINQWKGNIFKADLN